MKLALTAVAALLLAAPAAPVSYEARGIRVGGELVSGAALQVKGLEATTLLVSGSAVENLGTAVDVALDASHAVKLQAGLRLERSAEGFTLRSHGPALVLEAAGVALRGAGAVPFTLTPTGFDFGALGALEGAAFSVRTEAQDDGVVSPARLANNRRTSRAGIRNRVFRSFNPFVPGAAADRQALATLFQISPGGF